MQWFYFCVLIKYRKGSKQTLPCVLEENVGENFLWQFLWAYLFVKMNQNQSSSAQKKYIQHHQAGYLSYFFLKKQEYVVQRHFKSPQEFNFPILNASLSSRQILTSFSIRKKQPVQKVCDTVSFLHVKLKTPTSLLGCIINRFFLNKLYDAHPCFLSSNILKACFNYSKGNSY